MPDDDPADDCGFEALALRYLDGCAEPAAVAELRRALGGDAGLRARFARLALQHGQVSELLKAEEAPAPASRPAGRASLARRAPSARRPPARTTAASWVAAAAGLLVAATAAFLLSTPGAPAPLVHGLSGSAAADHDGRRVELAVGAKLHAGDVVSVGDGGALVIGFGDGTTIAVAAGSTLALTAVDLASTGIALGLEHGSLTAEVAPQPAGRPLVASTRHAQVTVLGTRFTLSADEAGSRLEVAKGRVRCASRSSADAVEVAAGRYAVVGRDQPLASAVLGEALPHAAAAAPPTERIRGTGLRGDYYDSLGFRDWRFSRVDPGIAFDWGSLPPDLRMEPETFSIRWTGEIEPEFSEEYTFSVLVDDGARLWIDDRLLIDEWHLNKPTEFSARIALVAGKRYRIRMDYYQEPNLAQVWLRWESPSQAKQIVPADRLFPPP